MGFSIYELDCNLFISLELKAVEGFLFVLTGSLRGFISFSRKVLMSNSKWVCFLKIMFHFNVNG